jgi:hypothetical protein
MNDLNSTIQGIIDRAAGNTVWRQRQCFNLIPSETTPSLLVKMCEISDPAGRYAEHRKMKDEELYFYQGIDFIREVEEEWLSAGGTSSHQRADGQRARLQGRYPLPEPKGGAGKTLSPYAYGAEP